VFKTEKGYGPGYFIVTLLAQVLLGILASMIVMWFSRHREFRADQGGAKLSGRDNMIAALQRLQQAQGQSRLPSEMEAMGISGKSGSGWQDLFRSHPPLDVRIEALRRND
jgi:heat shock protein HtpX